MILQVPPEVGRYSAPMSKGEVKMRSNYYNTGEVSGGWGKQQPSPPRRGSWKWSLLQRWKYVVPGRRRTHDVTSCVFVLLSFSSNESTTWITWISLQICVQWDRFLATVAAHCFLKPHSLTRPPPAPKAAPTKAPENHTLLEPSLRCSCVPLKGKCFNSQIKFHLTII